MKLTKITIEIKWALIFVATTLLWMVLEKTLGYHDEKIDQHAIVTNIFMIPAITIYVLAFLDKRKKSYQGKMTYTQGLVTGIIISIIVTLFIPITQTIISTIITPDYFDNMIAYSVANGLLTQEQAEANFTLQSYILQGLIGTPILGIVTSLIVAIFTRK